MAYRVLNAVLGSSLLLLALCLACTDADTPPASDGDAPADGDTDRVDGDAPADGDTEIDGDITGGDSDPDADGESDGDLDVEIEATQPPVITAIAPFPAAVHGLGMEPDGTLLFGDTFKKVADRSYLYRLAPPYTGQWQRSTIGSNGVAGILHLDGTIYVAQVNDNRIDRFDSSETLLQSWSVYAPWNLASDGARVFVVTYDGRVVELLADGDTDLLFVGLAYPFDLAWAGEDSLWISEQVEADIDGRVSRFDLEGTRLETIEAPFANPEGLATDAQGRLYIADTNAGKIYRYDGAQTEVLTDAYAIPICAVATPDNRILINTNHAGGTLLLIDP